MNKEIDLNFNDELTITDILGVKYIVWFNDKKELSLSKEEGDVYGYIHNKYNICKCCDETKEIHIDSCYGFFGNEGIMDALQDIKDFKKFKEVA